MTFVPVMWIVWCVLVVLTGALYIYRANLTKDEEDQIFLDDSFQHEQANQAAIIARVQKLQPVIRVALALAGVATLFIIGYYVLDIINQFK